MVYYNSKLRHGMVIRQFMWNHILIFLTKKPSKIENKTHIPGNFPKRTCFLLTIKKRNGPKAVPIFQIQT